MTLVARFLVDDVLVLISDTLLSTETPLQQTPIPLPSVRSSEKHHGDSPTTMAGLVQKMTLIDNNAVLCFAGKYSLGREILEYMKGRLSAGDHPEVAWKNMKRKFSLNDSSNVELIFEAMHPVGDGAVELVSKSVGLRRADDNYRSFDKAIFAGSGAATAEAVLERSDCDPVREIEWRYERAVQRGLHVAAELLNMDMRSSLTFDNHSGGFYEVAIWYGNKFKKIDGVQFAYWTIDIEEDATSLTLDRILLQYYRDDMLCVDEVLVDDKLPTQLDLTVEQMLPIANVLHHRIPSLSQGYEAQEFELSGSTGFQQKLMVHCCRIRSVAGFSTIATIISGKIQSACDDDSIRIKESSVVLAKDIGRFLKDNLVEAMEVSKARMAEQYAYPKEQGGLERIWRFFGGK